MLCPEDQRGGLRVSLPQEGGSGVSETQALLTQAVHSNDLVIKSDHLDVGKKQPGLQGLGFTESGGVPPLTEPFLGQGLSIHLEELDLGVLGSCVQSEDKDREVEVGVHSRAHHREQLCAGAPGPSHPEKDVTWGAVFDAMGRRHRCAGAYERSGAVAFAGGVRKKSDGQLLASA